ncbi:acyltransferase [Mucilaginibacter sp. UYCu711]|uniref:acyltransferase n=1 Tax=Mucilaginibacter sp. UYCu711 TaxID=3156339 RepID=UPI003D25FD63
MNQPYSALLRDKCLKVFAFIRVFYYKLLGMKIGQNTSIGSIKCRWPNKISLGNNCMIEDNVMFKTTHPFLESNVIIIGNNSFIGFGCEFNSSAKINIGNDCLIASYTTVVDTGHAVDKCFKINDQAVLSEEITILNDVWIGSKCIILKGIKIGQGSVVAAGSVVNKSIPDYEVWAGVPARFIKKR